ncbi:MAG: putative ZZ domain-containing protein [uncultured marine phage]|uniref:Putative ZZ domain-containing protein n=1 Tax=uncultured marine phage TaxID=707152 RepID=A0A8D9CEI2_9VIRU|nr:MAG: putative ZZ domain-containing protein [uncultured marine phage]
MKKVKIVNEKEIIEDILCDICGNSCLVYEHDYPIDNDGDIFKEFDYLSLSNHWGYHSKKDWETWSAQVCEECVDKHLNPLISFKKTDDMGCINTKGEIMTGSGFDISDKEKQKKVLRNGRLNKLLGEGD